MANTNAPFGFRHIGYAEGAAPQHSLATAFILKSNATAIFAGDPIKRLSTGYIAQNTAGTAANIVTGIFVQCQYNSISQGRTIWSNFWPGSDAASDPLCSFIPFIGSNPKFVVQSSGAAITLANIGNNADVTFATAGNTSTQISGVALDQTTINTTATLPFRIVDFWNGVGAGADQTTSFNWVIVQPNNSALAGI